MARHLNTIWDIKRYIKYTTQINYNYASLEGHNPAQILKPQLQMLRLLTSSGCSDVMCPGVTEHI